MTIRETIPLWDAALDGLKGREMRLRLEDVLAVLTLEGSLAADEACRAFAATGVFPQLAGRLLLEVATRLCCARWYVSAVPDEDLEESWPAFAESVLIEYWRDVGRRDWVLESLLKLPPAPDTVLPPEPPPWLE